MDSKAFLRSHSHSLRLLSVLITIAVLAGCKSSELDRPAIAAREDQTVVWHQLLSPDAQRSSEFLASVLNWQVSGSGAYQSIYTRSGELVGGMINSQALGWGLKTGGWLITLQSPDLDAMLEQVRQNGGKILQSPHTDTHRDWAAVVQDPQGAVFEVIQLTSSGEATPVSDDVWVWHNLITGNPQQAASWYARVFQLEVEDMGEGRKLLKQGDRKLATISGNPFEGQQNQWLPVVAADVEAALTQVTRQGGRIALTFTPDGSSYRLALIQDPTGAAILLQEALPAQLSEQSQQQ